MSMSPTAARPASQFQNHIGIRTAVSPPKNSVSPREFLAFAKSDFTGKVSPYIEGIDASRLFVIVDDIMIANKTIITGINGVCC